MEQNDLRITGGVLTLEVSNGGRIDIELTEAQLALVIKGCGFHVVGSDENGKFVVGGVPDAYIEKLCLPKLPTFSFD